MRTTISQLDDTNLTAFLFPSQFARFKNTDTKDPMIASSQGMEKFLTPKRPWETWSDLRQLPKKNYFLTCFPLCWIIESCLCRSTSFEKKVTVTLFPAVNDVWSKTDQKLNITHPLFINVMPNFILAKKIHQLRDNKAGMNRATTRKSRVSWCVTTKLCWTHSVTVSFRRSLHA